MARTMYRPAPLLPSLLTEIVCDDPDQRFAACVAVTSAVWGKGLQACRCQAEQYVWRQRLAEYLRVSREAWLTVGSVPDGDPAVVPGISVTHRDGPIRMSARWP